MYYSRNFVSRLKFAAYDSGKDNIARKFLTKINVLYERDFFIARNLSKQNKRLWETDNSPATLEQQPDGK